MDGHGRSVVQRLQLSLQAFRETFANKGPDIDAASKALDHMIDSGQMPSQVIQEKAVTQGSKLDVRTTNRDLAYVSALGFLSSWTSRYENKLPPYDSPERDYILSDMWREEPIMAGAVYSMTAKMSALRWAVTGKRLRAKAAASMLATAAHMDGWDWGGFIASTAQDFYTTNRGSFWETPRNGPAIVGSLAGLGHIDALQCVLTGNKSAPMVYNSEVTGQLEVFHPGEYIHFDSMPSPRERNLGMGFCAVDRAFRAMRLLMVLHDYDAEKLNNLPPEGVAAITGLTMEEFQDALTLWKAKRTQDKSLTFPQVLWLLGSQPNTTVGVSFSPFSQMPEQFDRQTVVTHYVATLAMCFGVDAREFWPISSGALGTGAESEIQHMKARGKGMGEFISIAERHINGELDEDTVFGFDTQDIEEDMNAAQIAKAWIDAFYPLYTGTPAGKSKASPAGKPNTEAVPNPEEIPQGSAMGQAMANAGPAKAAKAFPKGMTNTPIPNPGAEPGGGGVEQVITKAELKRLLADRGVLPEWMMEDERVRVDDNMIHIGAVLASKEGHPDDYTTLKYENGILKEYRLPPIILNSTPDTERIAGTKTGRSIELGEEYVLAQLKEMEKEILETKRNIKGDPIPDSEVKRGARITRKAIRAEIERWRNNPILAPYAPTDEELDKLMLKWAGMAQ